MATFGLNANADCVAVALPDAALKAGKKLTNISAPLQAALTESLQQRGLTAKSFPSRKFETVAPQALQADCPQILLTELSQKRKSRWNKWISVGLSVGSHHSGGGIGVGISTDLGGSSDDSSSLPVSRGDLASAQQLIERDDMITLRYQLQRADGQGVTGAREFKLQAVSDGDNVLERLAAQIAYSVAADLSD